jgi:gliding motility-associated lipoprotein GldD
MMWLEAKGRTRPTIWALACGLLLMACGAEPVPKPKGYFHITLPEQAYQPWTPDCPFSAELATYAFVKPHANARGACWFDMTFPKMGATVYLTYQPVQGRLSELIADAHDMKSKHQSMSNRIDHERVLRDSSGVWGLLFSVEGDVASPMVFYLTDSATHFLYGSLYFNTPPNADSLAPVTHRLRADIQHFAHTLRWR